jgi:SRSO17 transposase
MMNAVPKAGPSALPELDAYLAPFADLFRRCWSRQRSERSVTGLLTDLPHKTCQTIAAAVAGTSTERRQHLLTDADWDPLALDRRRVARLVARSPPDGLLASDDTTFPRQGRASVGVGHQYCGALGKVANGQTLVTAEDIAADPAAPTPWHWPVTARLSLPDDWLADPERRRLAHLPADLAPQIKHDVALAVIDRARAWGVPFRVVLADAGYGRQASFIRGLEERALLYACGVDKAFGVRRPEEVAATPTAPPPPTGRRGRRRKAHPAPLSSAKAVVAALPAARWQPVAWREGSRGALRRQFVALRRHWGTGEAGRSTEDPRVSTSAEGWLIAARPLDGHPDELRYSCSNLPADTPLERLAALVRARWPIEQFYEEAKQECGLGDDQGRRWDGLHRHVALVLLAYSFLAQQRMTDEERAVGRFSPLRAAPALAGDPARGDDVAVASARVVVGRDRPTPDVPLPPSGVDEGGALLTK